MKTDKIVWGLTLVFAGSVLLLDNFNIIDFYWTSIGQFWPLLLILIGTNMVLGRGKQTPWGGYALIVVTCLVLGFIAFVGINKPSNTSSRWSWSFNDHVVKHDPVRGHFVEAMQPDTRQAKLYIRGGGTHYIIEGSTDKLFEAEVERAFGRFGLEKTSGDSVQQLKFVLNNKDDHFDLEEIGSNRAVIKLNTQPVWDINLNMGAGKADFDLSEHHIENLKINGGAASLEIKLGMPFQETQVSMEAGLTEVKFDIPEAVGCRIVAKTGLSDEDFNGFEKQNDGSYQTPNYSTAAKKILINLKGGLSDFEVSRY